MVFIVKSGYYQQNGEERLKQTFPTTHTHTNTHTHIYTRTHIKTHTHIECLVVGHPISPPPVPTTLLAKKKKNQRTSISKSCLRIIRVTNVDFHAQNKRAPHDAIKAAPCPSI